MGYLGPGLLSAPFYYTIEERLSLSNRLRESFDGIKKSTHPRIMILETWLIVDFTIRHLIKSGLGIYRYIDDEISFLPASTAECIKILKKLIDSQKTKPAYPVEAAMIFSSEFFKKIHEDEELMRKLSLLEDDYYKKYFPNYDKVTIPVNKEDSAYRQVDPNWIFVVSKIDENWYAIANRINTARNKAAHLFDDEPMYDALGLKGKDKIIQVRKFCIKALNQLIGTKNI